MDTCTLFEEDEVYAYSSTKGYSFGLVLENSEFLSSSDEEEEEKDRLQKGTVRVAWHPSGREAVLAENKVQLVDRSLMPGDVVRRPILGQDSQCGYVTDMEVKAHLRILKSNKYIYNINSKDLQPIVPFESGQEVLMDSWWGRVENVIIELVLAFPDGAMCKVDESDLVMFDDVTEKPRDGEFSMGPHYPGQELKGPLYCLSEAKWLHSTPRYSHKVAVRIGKTPTVNIVVDKVETKSVEVQWVFGGSSSQESVQTPPPKIVSKDDLARLQVLDWFNHCSLQIGDRMLYQVKNDDPVVTTNPSQVFNPTEAFVKEKGMVVAQEATQQASNRDAEEKQASSGDQATGGVESTNKKEDRDAEFEDIEDSTDTDSGDEKPGPQTGRAAVGRGSKKKSKGGYKSARLKAKQSQKSGNKRGGVKRIERQVKPDMVVEVETELTTSWATVRWQDGSLEKDIPSVELFPVHHLDEHEFFPADFVLPNIDLPEPVDYGVVATADHAERTCLVHWFKAYDVGKETRPTLLEANCEVSVYDIKDHTDYKFRPGQSVVPIGGNDDANSASQTVGQIFELDGNGHLVVKWADGTISQRYPQEVFIVSDEVDEDSDNDGWDSESDYESDASSAETWETESEQEVDEPEEEAKAEREDSGYDQDAICEHRQELDSLLGRAQTALERLQKLLNTFDVTIQAPDCFHDILRIFRSCHDLDKILKSSFFRDPELRSLVAQAKQELKREKTNKFTKHLNQVFESWSQNMPQLSGSSRSFGLVGTNGQTVKFSARKANKSELEVSIQISQGESGAGDRQDGAPGEAATQSCQGATGGLEDISSGLSESTSTESCNFTGLGLKKELSEPAISKCLIDQGALAERRPSDSVVEGISYLPPARTDLEAATLVGENCVGKASKRGKSDGEYEDSGTDAKKSKEDKKGSSEVAQDLCLKICRNLQKQILLIHEEMNKRTAKLLQATGSESVGVKETNSKREPDSEPASTSHADLPCDPQPTDSVASIPPESSPSEAISGQEPSSEVPNAGLEEEEASHQEWPDLTVPCKGFEMVGEVPAYHVYITQQSQPSNSRAFRTAVRKELNLFQTSLPDGIFVKGYEDRLDLYSVMVLGPEGTPYEDALFLFDLMLPNDYPTSPPVCHYHSYCSDRLNPNLYEDGKVCVSLLGTWSGKGTEVWTAKSNLLQVLVSIQGLILVPEPYYNEAGFERQRGTQVGEENSRLYNEMAILKTLQSLTKMCDRLPTVFSEEIKTYLLAHGPRMVSRLRQWVKMSTINKQASHPSGVSHEASSADSGFGSGSPVQPSGNVAIQECANPAQWPVPSCDPSPSQPSCDTKQSFNSTYDIISVDSPAPSAKPLSSTGEAENQSKVCQVSSQLEHLSLVTSCEAADQSQRKPEFPLFPMSKGFCLTLNKVLTQYEASLGRLAQQKVDS